LREAISKAEDYVPTSKVDMDFESPENWLNVPEDFLSVAKLAGIPAENTDKFLHHFKRVLEDFRLASLLDVDGHHYEDAIKKIKTACEGLLLSLEYLDGHEGGSAMLNCFFTYIRRTLTEDPKKFRVGRRWLTSMAPGNLSCPKKAVPLVTSSIGLRLYGTPPTTYRLRERESRPRRFRSTKTW